jgi:hypothetical protein
MVTRKNGAARASVAPTYFIPADPDVPFPRLVGDEPCRQEPDLWFPERRPGNSGPEAQARCRTSCPVMLQCAQWALANPQLAAYGVWGGMTSAQRDAHLRNSITQEVDAA